MKNLLIVLQDRVTKEITLKALPEEGNSFPPPFGRNILGFLKITGNGLDEGESKSAGANNPNIEAPADTSSVPGNFKVPQVSIIGFNREMVDAPTMRRNIEKYQQMFNPENPDVVKMLYANIIMSLKEDQVKALAERLTSRSSEGT
jgi:hypothetical protein